MKQNLKTEIKRSFEVSPPDQTKKRQFLRSMPRKKIGFWKFLMIQAGFLRKWTLILSLLPLLPALIGHLEQNFNGLWAVCAWVPFLVLLAVSEVSRSNLYGMGELELSARFSLKSVVLARLVLFGLVDAVILGSLVLLCHGMPSRTLPQILLYVLVPYLLTAAVCLQLCRWISGKESLYACAGAAALISGGISVLQWRASPLFQHSQLPWWGLMTVLLLAALAYELRQTIKQTEEYPWNLSWIE